MVLCVFSMIIVEMVIMFKEWYCEGGFIDYFLGGGGSIIEVFVRGLEKYGGCLLFNIYVDEIFLEGGCVVG